MPEGKVFLSYSHEDKPFVKKLDKRLRALKLPTWQDIEQLRGGDDYWGKSASMTVFAAHLPS